MSRPHLTPADLAALCQAASASPRARMHRNLHAADAEPCQRLVNAMRADSYIRPHRHPDYLTNESLLALRGRFLLIEFDEAGEIVASLRMGGDSADVVVAELVPMRWHTIVALQDDCILFETKSGPYDAAAAKTFAPWAPAEGSVDAPHYLAGLRAQGLSRAGSRK